MGTRLSSETYFSYKLIQLWAEFSVGSNWQRPMDIYTNSFCAVGDKYFLRPALSDPSLSRAEMFLGMVHGSMLVVTRR